MTESKAVLVYPRLCIAYFCQFAIWGAWSGALGGYTAGVLNFSGTNIGWLYNAIPLGALIAPLFIGPIADRYFAAQKVISVLHLIGGLALLLCGWLCMNKLQNFPLLMGLMLLSGICFMPTIGLVNSVVFKHLPSASMGPYVFVWGTIGWIIVNLFIEAFFFSSKTPNFFFVCG
jgi:MFS family permease